MVNTPGPWLFFDVATVFQLAQVAKLVLPRLATAGQCGSKLWSTSCTWAITGVSLCIPIYIYLSLSRSLSLALSLSLTVTASYNHYKTILIQALCLANGRYTMIDVPRTSALLVFPMHWTLEQDANVGFKCPEWPACQLCTLKTVCHPTYAQHSTKYWIYTRDMHVQYRYHTCLKNIGRHQKSLEHSPLICSLLGFLEFEWLNDLFIGWLLLAVAQNLKTGCLQTYKTHH